MTSPKIVRRTDGRRAYVELACVRKASDPPRTCRFQLGAAQGQNSGGLVWQWDGDEAAPTITPSVACQSCGLHVVITKGVENGREVA